MDKNTPKIVPYYRVSTGKQAKSGLGLADQRDLVERYAAFHGATILESFQEAESGKITSDQRTALKAAIATAKAYKATLCVATLSRIGRKAADVLNLLDDKRLKVVFADSPHASPLENHMRAAFAEEEGRAISTRTKAALAQARRKGKKLGNYDGGRALVAYVAKHGYAKAGCEGATKHADEFAKGMRAIIEPMIKEGLDSAGIAARLNDREIESRRGKCWHETSVRRLRARLGI